LQALRLAFGGRGSDAEQAEAENTSVLPAASAVWPLVFTPTETGICLISFRPAHEKVMRRYE